jgi:hypothetical protein
MAARGDAARDDSGRWRVIAATSARLDADRVHEAFMAAFDFTDAAYDWCKAGARIEGEGPVRKAADRLLKKLLAGIEAWSRALPGKSPASTSAGNGALSSAAESKESRENLSEKC